MERRVSSLFEMRVGERAWPLAEAGAVVMALPLVVAGAVVMALPLVVAGTMQVRPPAILVLLSPILLAAVLKHSL